MKKTKIDHYTDKEALDFHNSNKSGKIEIISSKPMTTKRDLALAYSPGVAAPVKAIHKNPELAYDYTTKGNLVKILGIGNAIVDVICKIKESFLTDNGLTKSTMKLVDESEFKKLLSSLKIEETVSGGSVANSIVGLSQLGNKVGFIGKVNDDDLGQKYEDGLKKEKVEYFYSKKKEELPTGTCLILITPDSERTMCTFLGTAGKINENDVDINAVKNSTLTFLEGYLWDEGDPKKAFDIAIQHSNKVAMSLSDLFCVERHKPHFLDLVKNKLNIKY